MTGQVKEEILTRFGELGFRVRSGRITLTPGLLDAHEMLASVPGDGRGTTRTHLLWCADDGPIGCGRVDRGRSLGRNTDIDRRQLAAPGIVNGGVLPRRPDRRDRVDSRLVIVPTARQVRGRLPRHHQRQPTRALAIQVALGRRHVEVAVCHPNQVGEARKRLDQQRSAVRCKESTAQISPEHQLPCTYQPFNAGIDESRTISPSMIASQLAVTSCE